MYALVAGGLLIFILYAAVDNWAANYGKPKAGNPVANKGVYKNWLKAVGIIGITTLLSIGITHLIGDMRKLPFVLVGILLIGTSTMVAFDRS